MTKINSISPLKHKYLQIIDTIANKPKILYSKSTLPTDPVPTIAIVGTPKPTVYGKEERISLPMN